MKFTWFHLMPYRFLPEDFKEKYHSVWVDIPRDLYDPKVGHRLYNDYLDQLEYADLMGFDGLGVNEHHQNAYGLMPSPNIMAAALTRRTRNANLVVLGNSIALYNPPIRVAEEFAMLDVISGGRLIAGFPVGTSMDTNFCYGEVPATIREKYYEAHDLIIKAWESKDVFSFNGKYTKLRYVNLWPKPLQQPRPPIWIPGGGSVETYDFCIDNTYSYSYLSFSGYLRAQAPGDFGPGDGMLYDHVRSTRPEAIGTDEIKWNFTKFLVDRSGKVTGRYEPTVTPEDLGPDLDALLAT